MRKIIVLALAAMGPSLFGALPSSAQPQFQFGIGPDGRPQIGVRDPEQERYERRERWRERREQERARAYEEGRRDALRDERRYDGYERRCRNIIIREEDDWGRSVTRRVRRCD
ncbi:hypothetical protein [Microvirga calopogonii]|uniref:hypothetical protein n=1 Tax=Microvirga calopogonii TaxID=2078013 RepID=UPI000E0D7508|nr:hypothetical protein [Microvirga calopogonii]